MNFNIIDLYFKWMCSIAFPNEHIRSHYYRVLNLLNSIKFTYLIELDENRAKDGINLRYHFSYEAKIPYEDIEYILDNDSCSVLEMMIALAKRCENSMMADDNFGDRTSVWFWKMFCNLDLNKYPDDIWNESIEEEVTKIIYIFLNRQYDYYGNGNLFKFDNPKYDVRELEIWDQMNYYMSEIVEQNLRIT